MTSWFIIDTISSFPAESLTSSDDGQTAFRLNKLLRLSRIFKLFRVFRIARIIKRLEDFTRFNPAVLRLFKLLFVLAFVWHLIGCSYWFIADLENYCANDPFFAVGMYNT